MSQIQSVMKNPSAHVHLEWMQCAVSVTTCTIRNNECFQTGFPKHSHYEQPFGRSAGFNGHDRNVYKQHFKGQVCEVPAWRTYTVGQHNISVWTAPLRRRQKTRVCDLLNVTHASYSWQTWHKHGNLWLQTPPHQDFHSLIENKTVV